MSRTISTYVNPAHYPVAAKFVTAVSADQVYGLASVNGSPVSAGSADPISGGCISVSCPDYAAEFRVHATEECYLSESATFWHYTKLAADTDYIFGCGEMDSIYMVAIDTSATVYYSFTVIA